RLASEPALYFTTGEQSNSFLAPFLADASGLVNLDGDYTLGPGGANGAAVRSLIRQYSPRLRVLVRALAPPAGGAPRISDIPVVNDALQPFRLRLDTSDCAAIVVNDVPPEAPLT